MMGEKETEHGVQYDSIWGKFLNAEKHLERIPQFLIFLKKSFDN